MMTETLKPERTDRQARRVLLVLEWAVAALAGWCAGMLAAYGVIIANAKIGSGPTAHPDGTWFVGIHSAVLAIILAVAIRVSLGFLKKHLLLAAAVAMATPIATLLWLYS